MLILQEPVKKTYLLKINKHVVRKCRKLKREETTLISQIILLYQHA